MTRRTRRWWRRPPASIGRSSASRVQGSRNRIYGAGEDGWAGLGCKLSFCCVPLKPVQTSTSSGGGNRMARIVFYWRNESFSHQSSSHDSQHNTYIQQLVTYICTFNKQGLKFDDVSLSNIFEIFIWNTFMGNRRSVSRSSHLWIRGELSSQYN